MKRIFIFILIVLAITAPLYGKSKKGRLSVKAKMSLYDPPGSAKVAPMFTLEATYRMSAKLAISGSGSWTSYPDGDANITFIPIAVTGEVHPLGYSVFDPYAGAGLAGNLRQIDYEEPIKDKTEFKLGTELFGGVSYKPKGFLGFELELRYRIEDIANPGDTGSFSVGGGITGTWETDL